jgi:alpha-tubulin suppressor-like RCC1 family protein
MGVHASLAEVFQPQMKPRFIVSFVAGLVLLNLNTTKAAPLRLKVEPKGTNALEITLTPTVPGAFYGIMTRANGADGHWLSLTGLIGSSNGTSVTTCTLGGPGELAELRIDTLRDWTFVAGWDEDTLGDGLSPLYKELVLRCDPLAHVDSYAQPAGDGWTIAQKRQNNWNPLVSYQPPQPRLTAAFYVGTNSTQSGRAVLTIQNLSGVLPDYIEIEKADRTWEQPPEDPRLRDPRFQYRGPADGGGGTNGSSRMPGPNRPPFTNRAAYMNWLTNRPGLTNPPPFTNRPFAGRPPPFNRPPSARPKVVTGPFKPLAKIITKPGVQTYTYTDTITNTLLSPEYQCWAHFAPPFRSTPAEVDPGSIRKSLLTVQAQPTTNGYNLVVTHPFPYAMYLLLVRDQRDPQWRASGYFVSGTNRDPIQLNADLKGMMAAGEGLPSMPAVKFQPDAVQPEFIAGSGDDSDGDGLPDVYEVMVTRTDPAKADTGNTGVLDGYKETSDGWSTLEKFRRRLDPLKPFTPPAPLVLSEPTLTEAAQSFALRSDLPYQPQVEIRVPGTAQFHVVHRAFWLLYGSYGMRDTHVRACFDLRVSWVVPQPRPHEGENDTDAYSMFAFAAAGAEAVRDDRRDLPPGQTNRVIVPRWQIEAYAATNAKFAPAMDYFIATTDGRQPAELPSGLSLQEIEAAVATAFPGMTNTLDRPVRFYGKIVDENARPISGFKVRFEWSGTLLPGKESADAISDAAGLFSLTNAFGTQLSVFVDNTNYYTTARNRGSGSFQYTASGREAFKPDPNHPVVYVFRKKGVGARSLVTSEYGVSRDFSVKAPLDGTPVRVNLLERKTGSGPLEISQIKPVHAGWRTPTNWSFTMKIPDGGFVIGGAEEFPFHPPASGYQPEVSFHLDKGQTNWTPSIQKDYYFRFGDPSLYGRLHVDTRIDSDSVRLSYTINRDGERNLEPPNEYTQTKAPVPFVRTIPPLKPKAIFTNASGQVVTWGSMMLPFVKPGTRFTAVAAGGEHSLAIKEDGTVLAWGRNISGESTVPPGLSNVVAVSAGGRSGTGFSIALRRDGTVSAWGDNSGGQTKVPTNLTGVIAISAGRDHCLALKKDGAVVAWGSNASGKTQVPPELADVVGISAAGEHSVALKRDGTIVAWGQRQWGQTNGPEGLSNVTSICCGNDFGLAQKKDGSLVTWGQPFSKDTDIPKDLANVSASAAGPWNALALKRDGTVTEWGHDTFGATHVPVGLNHVTAVSCGGNDHGGHTLALKADGSIVGWGNNNYGQSLPPGGLTDVISVSGGNDHYLALRKDGSVVAWGGGERQDIGHALVPPDLGPVKQVAAGWSRSVVLRIDGSAAGWGDQFFGLNGPALDLTNLVAVSAAINSLALKKDGTVVEWADSCAIRSKLFSNAVATAAAPHHNIALRQDGKVLTSGADGTLAVAAPADLTNVIAIATWGDPVFDHDLVLRRDGTVFEWGSRGPVALTKMPEHLTNVIAIAAGPIHNLALRRDGTVTAWGGNVSGQLNVPEGLTNVIAVSAAGGSSAAVVFMPEPQLSGLRTHAIRNVVVLGAILLSVAAGLWMFRRHLVKGQHNHPTV